MRTSDFDSWVEGRNAAKHLQTLFWMGGDIYHWVLRWRGKAFPDVGERFKTSFQQLELHEEWIVEVGEEDNQGIHVLTSRQRAAELQPTFEERVAANQWLRADEQITANTLADFKQIMVWLKQFNDTPA